MAPQAMPYRALSRHCSAAPTPRALGSRFSLGTFTSLKTSSPVTLVRSDHLLVISGVVKPSIPRSKIIPCTRPAGFRAQTTATSANGALEIQVFEPFKIYSPSTSVRRDCMPAGLEPWSGSVRPKQPRNSPEANLGKYFCFCASVPNL